MRPIWNQIYASSASYRCLTSQHSEALIKQAAQPRLVKGYSEYCVVLLFVEGNKRRFSLFRGFRSMDQFELNGVSPAQSTAGLFILEELSAFSAFGSQLVSQCRSKLRIYSPRLSPEFYAAELFVDACSALARLSRRSELEILVQDAQPLIENYHPLVGLQKRLSDKIKLRVLPKDFDPENIQKLDRAFMVGDDCKILLQHNSSEWKGFVNLEDRPKARELSQKFNYLWQYGSA